MSDQSALDTLLTSASGPADLCTNGTCLGFSTPLRFTSDIGSIGVFTLPPTNIRGILFPKSRTLPSVRLCHGLEGGFFCRVKSEDLYIEAL